VDDFEDVKDLRFVPAEREFRVKEDLKEEGLKLDVSTKARIEATIEVLCKFLCRRGGQASVVFFFLHLLTYYFLRRIVLVVFIFIPVVTPGVKDGGRGRSRERGNCRSPPHPRCNSLRRGEGTDT
jgi:hypothetical protein